jgi:hypothetical protein
MPATAITTAMAGAINYTYVTDNATDWSLVPSNTYFYDKADKLVHYKDSTGVVQEIFSAAGGGVTVGTTTVTSGTNGRVFFQAGGVVQQDANFTFDNILERLTLKAVGTAATDIPFVVRNSADTRNFLTVNGAGDVFNNGAQGVATTTLYGENSGRSSTGLYNCFFGFEAGRDNSTGANNCFFGVESGRFTTTGGGNSFFGTSAGRLNGVGISNSFFGGGAGTSNSSGNYNSFVGSAAGESNTTGSFNSCFGFSAGQYNATGGENVFLGVESGRRISSGSNLTVANNSVFLGGLARANANSETNQIVIGHSAIGLGSNTAVIGNASTTLFRPYGNVAIGANSAAARLDVRAQGALSTDIAFRVRNSADTADMFSVRGNGEIYIPNVSNNTSNFIYYDTALSILKYTNGNNACVALGQAATFSNGTFYNTAIGASATIGASGVFGIAIGFNTLVNSSGGIAIGDRARTSGTDTIVIGNTGGNTTYSGTRSIYLGKKGNAGNNFGSDDVFMTHFNSDNSSTLIRANGSLGLLGQQAYIFANGTGTNGTDTFMGNGGNTLVVRNHPNIPSLNITDSFQQYSSDITAGNAAPHFRTENGSIVKLYQETAAHTAQDIANALTNQGLLASSLIMIPSDTEVFRGRTFRYDSTTADTVGGLATLNNASSSAVALNTTLFANRFTRLRYFASIVTTGRVTSIRSTDLQWYLSGGFRYVTTFRVSDTAFGSTCQSFFGLIGTTAEIVVGGASLIQVSTLTNCIFVGNDGADTNLQVMHNDATGTCTKIDLGVNFPANRTAGAEMSTMYSIELYNKVNTTSVIYKVINLETSSFATGTITTDLPAITQGLAIQAARVMGTPTTGTGQFELHKWGCSDIII